MVTILSIIFAFGLAALTIILCIINSVNVFLAILFGFLTLVLVVAIFTLGLYISVRVNNKKLLKVEDPKTKWIWRYMNDISHFVCFWLGIRIHKKGFEKLPKYKDGDPGLVFYSNHQGFIDFFLYDLALKDYPRGSMYKIEHNDNNILKGFIKALGGVGIDRSNDRQAIKGILEIVKKVKSGVNFMIYPEGTRSKGLGVREYHAGSFKVCQKAEANLCVMALDGAYKKLTFVPLIPTHIYIEVVEVLPIEVTKDMPTIELSTMCHDKCVEALEKARKSHWYLKENKEEKN